MAPIVAGDDVEEKEEPILYELTIQAEWRQDPEPPSRFAKEKIKTSTEPGSTWNLLWTTFGSTVSSSNISDLPFRLVQLINSQINWRFALSQKGDQLAILQDSHVEIRTSENEFTTLQNKWTVSSGRDPYPQWRCLAWSRDGSAIAVSDSSGQIEIYDTLGMSMCRIPSKRSTILPDFSLSFCALIFKELKTASVVDDQHWFAELLAVSYEGFLTSYLISQEGNFQLCHSFDFTDVYPSGVSTVAYDPSHSLLFVGGSALSVGSERVANDNGAAAAINHGITAWRILSGLPYYKRVADYEMEQAENALRHPLVKRFKSRLFGWSQNVPPDGVFKVSLSPNSNQLACIHYSGMLSLWDIPSLRLRQTWPLELQPEYNVVNMEIAENPKLRKKMKDHMNAFYLSDVGWWSNNALILARGNGAILVASVQSLENLLGLSPEWFEPRSAVASVSEGSFLGLECESRYGHPKRHLESESDSSHEEEYEEDTDDELSGATIGSKVAHYFRQGLYYVMDSEHFQPPRKKQKFIEKTYRLICLKSTTPEELYARKIDDEEYGEALILAQSYHLDSDLVYQRQWKKSPVSVATIQDYLTKISKRSWVLHECVERVPEDLDAMSELLKYGLRGTDLEALVTIGRKEDKGRFIFCQDDYDVYYSLDAPNSVDSAAEARANKERRKQEWLSEVDFDNLSLEQQDLCRIRLKLLHYNDRLMTYQAILGGFHVSAEKYDHKFFEKFRSQNVVEMAIDYARASDATALSYLFTYHGKETLPHRLMILSNFPETVSPEEYSDLLPELSFSFSGVDRKVVQLSQSSWRDSPDWCEQNYFCARNVPEDFAEHLYEELPQYVNFRKEELTSSDLTEWYEMRACEIESLSGQLNHALCLVQLAAKKNVQNLDKLLDDLLVMETLVYECQTDETLTFTQLRAMSNIEKLRLMMSRSSEEIFLKNFRKWVIPFLRKCDEVSSGSFYTLLHEYLVGMATDDLTFPAIVLVASKALGTVVDPIITDHNQLITVALDSVYAYRKNDELNKSFEILNCLPEMGSDRTSIEDNTLFNLVNQLRNHLVGAEILQQNGLPQTVNFIRDSQSNSEEAMKIFTRMTRTAARQQPPIGERRLKLLLSDLCQLRDKVYRCVSRATCYEVFVESLLCSGCTDNIELAGRMIEHSAVAGSSLYQQQQQQPKRQHPQLKSAEDVFFQCQVPYLRSVQLVLAAAREYFDSSATLGDSDMQLSRTCLSLITDQNKDVEVERDLIEAVGFLEGFSVSILPIQVRICKDRLDLIRKCLAARRSAYKKSQKLLKLGKLLRVGGNTEMEARGQVLRLVAEAAFQNNDSKSCYEACAQLMDAGYSDVWKECRDLAEMEDFTDVQAKLELLSFAVVHCSSDAIEPILQAKTVLEAQLLCEQIHARLGERESASSPSFSRKGGALSQTKDILRSTNKATRSVLLHISDSRWWKQTLSGLRPAKRDHQVDDFDDLNSGFHRQSCHPFYESVFDKAYVNKSDVDYGRMRLVRTDVAGLSINEGLLRMAKLEEAMTEGQNVNLASQVLLQLAEDVIVQDSSLGLAYLLALPNVTDAETCFGKLPSTMTSLQLAIYYYALQIAVNLLHDGQSTLDDVYRCPPQQLSETVLSYVQMVRQQGKESDLPDDVRRMAQKILNYYEKLLDFVQVQTLEGLHTGVDVSRFVQDDNYKRETIIGMVLCMDDEVFQIALSLAARHKVPAVDVYMAHLEFLFETNSLSTDEIDGRIQSLGILSELTKDSQVFVQKMKENVYPLIDGTDIDRLLLFYTLLSGCTSTEGSTVSAEVRTMSASLHVRLLKKIKTTAPGLNYKHLIDGSFDPMDILSPVISQDNVDAIAKLATIIKDKDGNPLTSSQVYQVLASKIFWKRQQDKHGPDNPSDWIHRYEACFDCVQKLNPDDFLSFVKTISFSENAISQLPLDCRRQILRRTLKHSKQQQQNMKKKMTKDGLEYENLSWDKVVSQIQSYLEHIDRLSSPFLQDARNSSDSVLRNYAIAFDLSCSQPEKVEELLVKMVLDGQPFEVVEEMLVLASKIRGFTLKSITEMALKQIVSAMKNSNETAHAILGLDLSLVLEKVLTQLSEHQSAENVFVKAADVVDVLLSFCRDSDVPANVRVNVLNVITKTLHLEPNDQSLLLFYKTQAKVSALGAVVNEIQVTEEGVETDEGRQMLFNRLLPKCRHICQLKVLQELLDIWPECQPLSDEQLDDPLKNSWCLLVDRFLDAREEITNEILSTIVSLCGRESLSAACVSYVADRLLNSEPVRPTMAIKCLLIGHHSQLYSRAIDVLVQLKEDFEDEDEEILELILKRHLVTDVMPLTLYPRLVEYILGHQSTDSSQTPDYVRVDSIARQLQEAGYQAEAGTLLLRFRSTHRSLGTFDAAFSVLSHLFRR